jgi:hypothetical protein
MLDAVPFIDGKLLINFDVNVGEVFQPCAGPPTFAPADLYRNMFH